MSKLSFDTDLYNGYKEIADNALNNIPFYYQGSFKDWAIHQLPLISDFDKEEDYEACKAVKDAFIDYVNKYIEKEEDKIELNSLIKLNHE